METDVLIIGSGAVGVAASIQAREAGASVVVLEQEASLGGAAVISGGGCSLVDTELQRAEGIGDSTDLEPNGCGKLGSRWMKLEFERVAKGQREARTMSYVLGCEFDVMRRDGEGRLSLPQQRPHLAGRVPARFRPSFI